MSKKKPPYNKNSQIRGALRRAFARSPVVKEKMMEARMEIPRYKKDGTLAKKPHVRYQCETCTEWVSSTKIEIDHVKPVISVDDGFVDWNTFIDMLWCDKENLKRCCSSCHDAKTHAEMVARLTIKYTKELDELESKINSGNCEYSEIRRVLKKYTKKAESFKGIIDRANSILISLKK